MERDGIAADRVCAAVDVHYPRSGGARAAAVVAADASFSRVVAEWTAEVREVAAYRPGEFYLRELPVLRAVLRHVHRLGLLVVDGYADLDPAGRPGLGAYAHTEFGVPVIGVAKSAFRPATHAVPVWRGRSARPLFITAAGLPVSEAAELVRHMAGGFRLPDALRRADALARTEPDGRESAARRLSVPPREPARPRARWARRAVPVNPHPCRERPARCWYAAAGRAAITMGRQETRSGTGEGARMDAAGIRMPFVPLAPGGPMVSRIGLGLAALGRPAYITTGRDHDLPDRSIAGMRARTFAMLDAAYGYGIRYFDAARSYGRAEQFLGSWLAVRGHPDAVCGSKWGYRYAGDWRLDAARHEIKEHSLAAFARQLEESRALLSDRLALYQVHSVTSGSGVLDDQPLLAALARLRADGVIIGLTTSGPGQAEVLRRALTVNADGLPLFAVAQVTWNPLETSAGPAAAEAADAGWTILIKEALANGRLAGTGPDAPPAPLAELATAHGVTPDAIALAAALANPWASAVLSGAVTRGQLRDNLAALGVGALPELSLAEPPGAYWAARSARAWR